MTRGHRYKTSHLTEDQKQPGSQSRVLRNLLGIRRKKEMDRIEAVEQLRALQKLLEIYGADHSFTAEDIRIIHKLWLVKIYSWAGQYRSVNISKSGFSFAVAREIPKLMMQFEKDILAKYTPCRAGQPLEGIARALAVVHVELVLIHPFREGNGRVARLLAILMALQAGLPVLEFGGLRGRTKEYIAAIHAGISREYGPMADIFLRVIRRTLKNVRGKV